MASINNIPNQFRGMASSNGASGNSATGYVATPSVQRQWATGHGLAWWASDHQEELNHIVGWNYVAIQAIAKQYANSKVTVSRVKQSGGQNNGGMVTKAYTPDAGQDTKTPLPNHPIARLLKKPNRVDSWATFAMRIAYNMRATGGFFIWEIKNQLNQPFELWVIPRAWAWPILPSPQFPQGAWRITPSSTTAGVLSGSGSILGMVRDAREFIASGYPHQLYPGEFLSPLSACAQQIDLAEMTDQAAWAVFNNAIVPGAVFSIDKDAKMDEEQQKRFIAQLEQQKAGVSNRGKALLLQGITKESLGDPLTGLNHIEGRNQNREHVSNIQGVPPSAYGGGGGGGYSGTAAEMKQFTELTVQPDLNLVAMAFQTRWSPVYGEDIEIAIDAPGYDDPTLNLQKCSNVLQAKQAGVKFSDNEIRSLLGFGSIPGGDKYEELGQQGHPQPDAMQEQGQPQEDEEQQQGHSPEMAGGEEDENAVPDFDLTPELADEDGPNEKNPLLQAAAGNRISPYLMNGKH